ncbi:MAG: hypothetical protein R3F04_12435 [Lysobacteraceae bacterium]
MFRQLAFSLAVSVLLPVQAVSAQAFAFDPSFDLDGERENPFPVLQNIDADRVLHALAVDPEGRITVVGTDGPDSLPSPIIGRIDIAGAPDGSFGTSGLAALTRGGENNFAVHDLVLLPNGDSLVCGDLHLPTRTMGFVAKVRADGTQDTTWAPGSADSVVLLGNAQAMNSNCYALDQLGDGRIIAGGSIQFSEIGGHIWYGMVAMLSADGYFAENFASDGLAILAPSGPATLSQVFGLVEQPGLGILVHAGESDLALSSTRADTLRLTYDGEIDAGFTLITNSQSAHPSFGFLGPIASEYLWVLPDGRIRLAEPRHSSGVGYVATSLLSQYASSTWIGHDFYTIIWGGDAGNNPTNEAYEFGGAALGADGKVLVAGRYMDEDQGCSNGWARQGLTRLLHDGTLDNGFAAFGQYLWTPTAAFGTTCSNGVIAMRDVAIGHDGKIISLASIRQNQPTLNDQNLRPLITRMQGSTPASSPWDVSPAALTLPATTTRPNTLVYTDYLTITGLGAGVHVPAYLLGGEISHNFGSYRNTAAWVKNGDVLRLRAFAPAQGGASNTARLIVGGIRAHNSWHAMGASVETPWQIHASNSLLPGVQCSAGGLNSNCSAAIPDQGQLVSSINFVNDGTCNFITEVRVGVDITHTYVGDLRLTLTDPNGQVFIGGSEGIVNLLDRPSNGPTASSGSCLNDDVLATFTDAAALDAQTSCGLPVNQPGLSGELRPANALSQLAGRRTTGNSGAASTGVWTLTVADLANGDSGTLNDWSLDIDCSATAPGLSDLAVSVTGTTPPVAGSTVELTWTVTNLGPGATNNGRFATSLPSGLDDALENAAWGCTTSAGGSCTPDIACFGACVGSEIGVDLALPVNGTATIFATATLTELAGATPLSVGGRVSVPLTLNGSRDHVPGNDQAQYFENVERHTDIAVTGLQHVWQGQTVTVTASFSNGGPSLASGFGGQIDLPDGLVIQQFGCDRSPFACDLTLTQLAGNTVRFDSAALLANRAPYTLTIAASWAGSTSPGGVTASVDAAFGDTDPNLTNNMATQMLSAPTPVTAAIFKNGFE